MHDVKFSIPERELGRADLEFKVAKDGAVLGRLCVSNGSLVWKQGRKRTGFKLRWSRFGELAEKYGDPGHN
jgi:hypothetical protein